MSTYASSPSVSSCLAENITKEGSEKPKSSENEHTATTEKEAKKNLLEMQRKWAVKTHQRTKKIIKESMK